MLALYGREFDVLSDVDTLSVVTTPLPCGGVGVRVCRSKLTVYCLLFTAWDLFLR